MKETIRSLLIQAWSSTINGIDVDKSVELLNKYIEEVKSDAIHIVSKAYAEELSELNDDLDSFEKDLEQSNSLLIEAKEELEKYKNIQSNNPLKYQELNNLLFRIQEQIIENGK